MRTRTTSLLALAAAIGGSIGGAVSVTGMPATTAPAALPQATYGPVLDEFGPVYFNGEVDFATPTDRDYKAVFDISTGADEPDARSAAIESAARFLNMHAQAGVAPERLGAAVVLHGGAARYALDDEAYRARYGSDNPNTALLVALRAVGARIVLCGQSAASRGIAPAELAKPVELALSAMTAIKVLQDEGYQIVAF